MTNQLFDELKKHIPVNQIKSEDGKYLEFGFYDPVSGNLEMRAYVHDGDFVVTTWGERPHQLWAGKSSLVYTPNFDLACKQIADYFTNPKQWYEDIITADFNKILEPMADFVKQYGVAELRRRAEGNVGLDESSIASLDYLLGMLNVRRAVAQRIAQDAALQFRRDNA